MTSPGTDARTVTTTHTLCVAAPPRAVYRLIADATRWPYLFSPFVHVERLSNGGSPRAAGAECHPRAAGAECQQERLRLWAVGNGAVRDWTTQRTLDREAFRIRFRQEAPAPPVASMAGEWVFVPLPGEATSVVLLHEFRAIGDDPVNTALIKQAVDRNSTAELAALRSIAELGERLSVLVHTFADSVTIRADVEPVYEFLYRAAEWPRRLPHVSRLILDEAVPGVQTVEMDSGAPGEPASTTRLVRVCFPYHSIRFKQTHPPEAMSAHVGEWRLYPADGGIRVTAHNTVMLRPDRAADAFGQCGAAERAAEAIRQSLRRTCLAVLLHAKDAAEGRSRAAG